MIAHTINPDFSWLPDILTNAAGGALTWGIIGLTAAFVIALAAWAIGTGTGNREIATRGKSTAIACLIAALILGVIPFAVPWITHEFLKDTTMR